MYYYFSSISRQSDQDEIWHCLPPESKQRMTDSSSWPQSKTVLQQTSFLWTNCTNTHTHTHTHTCVCVCVCVCVCLCAFVYCVCVSLQEDNRQTFISQAFQENRMLVDTSISQLQTTEFCSSAEYRIFPPINCYSHEMYTLPFFAIHVHV